MIDTVRIKNPINQTLRGMFAMTAFWSNFLTGILPLGSKGILVVFENECNPTFTFQVIGPAAEFLGRGDLHDQKYTQYEKNVSTLNKVIVMIISWN
jgi:hypothetical protein